MDVFDGTSFDGPLPLPLVEEEVELLKGNVLVMILPIDVDSLGVEIVFIMVVVETDSKLLSVDKEFKLLSVEIEFIELSVNTEFIRLSADMLSK